jgi:hypothetical protein
MISTKNDSQFLKFKSELFLVTYDFIVYDLK